MLILAITTSSKTCSVSILEDREALIELNIENEKTHSENLMPLIDKAFKETGKNVADLDLISCDIGPGSFTGIRIGIATCKAIAEVNNIPVCMVSSLEGLSYNVDKNDLNSTSAICSLIDARNNQVYCGIFNFSHELIEEYLADDINEVKKVLEKYDSISFVGNGSILHKSILNGTFSNDNVIHASNIGICGYEKFKKGKIENASTIIPMYLRKSQAERMKDLK